MPPRESSPRRPESMPQLTAVCAIGNFRTITRSFRKGASAIRRGRPRIPTTDADSQLANDRMSAHLRVEVDNPDAVAAGNEVNTRMGKALARAKAVRGVEAATTGYSSYQYSERNQPIRWRVAQTLSLESSDFTTLAA